MSNPDLQPLIDAAVATSGLFVAERIFVLVAGMDEEGEPVQSEMWINLNDQDTPIDSYTKNADVSFVQQGLAVEAMLNHLEAE